MFSILEKVIIGGLGEGFIDPGYHRFTQCTCIWNDFEKFRTGSRIIPTVSATGPRFIEVSKEQIQQVADPEGGGGLGGLNPPPFTGVFSFFFCLSVYENSHGPGP